MLLFVYKILQCTWGIIQTLLGFIIFLVHCKNKHFCYHGAIVTQWQSKSSMSLGLFVFVTSEPFFTKKYEGLISAEELSKFGVDIKETDDGLIINGPTNFKGGAVIETYNDHRIAMSAAIAAILADSDTVINDSECVDISFPTFYKLLEEL